MRMLCAEPGRVGEHDLVLAEREPRGEPLFLAVEAQLLEPGRLAEREVVVGDIGERRPAPERERAAQLSDRELGVPGHLGRAACFCQLLEPNGIERRRVDRGPVAGGNRLDHLSSELAAEVRDVLLDELRRGGRRCAVP